MTLWCEVRAWQQRVGKPVLVPLAAVDGYRGFRSVYCFDSVVAGIIRERGSTEGLRDSPVYSDTLFLDFDDTDPTDTMLLLYDEGISHRVYQSGNRSIHIHVDIEPMAGLHVPWSQRLWVAANCPGADHSFYHAAGMYRLPGTMHEKTRRRKVLLHTIHGSQLEIPLVEPRSMVERTRSGVTSSKFMALLLRRQDEPGRRVFAWRLAKTAHDEGLSEAEALEGMRWWNSRFCFPSLEDRYLVERTRQVYRRSGTRLNLQGGTDA